MRKMDSETQTRLQHELEKDVLAFIHRHQLHKGDALPPQKELAEELGVSMAALREALIRLQGAGVVRFVHGRGTFLASDPDAIQFGVRTNFSLSEMIREMGMTPGSRQVWLGSMPAPEAFADFLGAASGEAVACLQRTRTADGAPFAYAVGYFARRFAVLEMGVVDFPGSLYAFCEEAGEAVYESEAVIEAQEADGETCRRLLLAPGTAVLALIQQHRNRRGEPVFASVEYFKQHQLRLKFSRVRTI